jgi:hypothetical protein
MTKTKSAKMFYVLFTPPQHEWNFENFVIVAMTNCIPFSFLFGVSSRMIHQALAKTVFPGFGE